MAFSPNDELRIEAIEKSLNKLQIAANNLATRKELKNSIALLSGQIIELTEKVDQLEVVGSSLAIEQLDAHKIDPNAHANLFVTSSSGPSDAGKSIKLDSDGKIDSSFLSTVGITVHSDLSGLDADDHPNYAYLFGRDNSQVTHIYGTNYGQKIYGGTSEGGHDGNLWLISSWGARGKVFFGDDTSTGGYFDESNGNLQLGGGQIDPALATERLTIFGNITASGSIHADTRASIGIANSIDALIINVTGSDAFNDSTPQQLRLVNNNTLTEGDTIGITFGFTHDGAGLPSIHGYTGMILTDDTGWGRGDMVWGLFDGVSQNEKMRLTYDGNLSVEGNIDLGGKVDGRDIATDGSTLDTAVNDISDLLSDLSSLTTAVTNHTDASSGVHGITGSVVGTTDAQTLTNKTLTTPTIANFTNANHSHQNSAGGGKLDHGLALDGLSDDDHPQYLLASGSRALSGNLAVDALVTIDGRDISVDGATLDALDSAYTTHAADSTIHFTVGSIDHGSITGLGDDDHTIYIKADGTRAFTDAQLGTRFASSGSGPLQLGGGGTANRVTTSNDVYISHALEVDGQVDFDGPIVFRNNVIKSNGSSIAFNSLHPTQGSSILSQASPAQLTLGLGTSVNAALIFTTQANVFANHSVSSITHPATYWFSSTSLASATDEWGRTHHNSTDFVISTGKGGVKLDAYTIFSGSIKDTTGDPSSPSEGQLTINTTDKVIKIYADGAWRTLVTW